MRYCNFLEFDYCTKYDFSPAMCVPGCDNYGCTWKERRLPEYRVIYQEDISYGDMMYEKRLSLFREFYYDRERFNVENYQDILDYYEYLNGHMVCK